ETRQLNHMIVRSPRMPVAGADGEAKPAIEVSPRIKVAHRVDDVIEAADHDFGGRYARSSAAFTRAGVNGTRRRRTPVASNTALPIAAGTKPSAISAAPEGAASGRSIRTISIVSGAESMCSTG